MTYAVKASVKSQSEMGKATAARRAEEIRVLGVTI